MTSNLRLHRSERENAGESRKTLRNNGTGMKDLSYFVVSFAINSELQKACLLE